MIPPFILVAFGWLRSLTWRQIFIGLATLGAAFLYLKGRSDERRAQRTENLEDYIDVQKKAADAEADAVQSVDSLSDGALNDRLREQGALRD